MSKLSNWKTALIAIGCITGLEAYALTQGVNGICMSTAIAAIAGLGGFTLGKVLGKNGKGD